jgi:hypothetical protein
MKAADHFSEMVMRLIAANAATPHIAASLIADQALTELDPNGEADPIFRAACHAQFRIMATEVLEAVIVGTAAGASELFQTHLLSSGDDHSPLPSHASDDSHGAGRNSDRGREGNGVADWRANHRAD